jgi:hypothetical protein
MGYIIPTTLVRFILGNLSKNKKFSGLCTLGVDIQPLNNLTLREYYGLPVEIEGILVTEVQNMGPSKELLKTDDIILKIDDITIHNDNTVSLREIIMKNDDYLRILKDHSTLLQSDEIVPYSNILSLKTPGDIIEVVVLRNKKQITIKVKVEPEQFLVPILEYQIKSSCYIVAGLVFIPLSYMFINEKKQNKEHVSHLITMTENTEITQANEQLLVLSQIFHTELTEDYRENNDVLESVNKTKIINLVHLREIVTKEIQKTEYIIFKFRNVNNEIILKSSDIKKYSKEILEDNTNSDRDFY